jgi:hypothetical protein
MCWCIRTLNEKKDVFAILVEPAILLQVSRFATLATLGFPLVAALIYGVVGHFAILAE